MEAAQLTDMDFYFFTCVYIYTHAKQKKIDMLAICEK